MLQLRQNEKCNYFLLSTYNENLKDLTEIDLSEMLDEYLVILCYIIRYPMLDKDGYYILSGMYEGFDEETFSKKYGMNISKYPNK